VATVIYIEVIIFFWTV